MHRNVFLICKSCYSLKILPAKPLGCFPNNQMCISWEPITGLFQCFFQLAQNTKEVHQESQICGKSPHPVPMLTSTEGFFHLYFVYLPFCVCKLHLPLKNLLTSVDAYGQTKTLFSPNMHAWFKKSSLIIGLILFLIFHSFKNHLSVTVADFGKSKKAQAVLNNDAAIETV